MRDLDKRKRRTRFATIRRISGRVRFSPSAIATTCACAQGIYRRPYAGPQPYRIRGYHRECIVAPGASRSSRLSLRRRAWKLELRDPSFDESIDEFLLSASAPIVSRIIAKEIYTTKYTVCVLFIAWRQ